MHSRMMKGMAGSMAGCPMMKQGSAMTPPSRTEALDV